MAKDQEFANKLQNTINRLSDLSDRLDAGEGSAGKFLRDPALYNNTNQLLLDTPDAHQSRSGKSQKVSDHPSEAVLKSFESQVSSRNLETGNPKLLSPYLCSKSTGCRTSCTRKYCAIAGCFFFTSSNIA